MSKSKGSNAERELIRMFWEKKWGAVRVAGSGSMHYPSPDLLVSNKIRVMALEVKATKSKKKYFPKDEIKQLFAFTSYFGAEAWIAIKFFRRDWVFINPEDLEETPSSYAFAEKNSEKFGLSFEDLIMSI